MCGIILIGKWRRIFHFPCGKNHFLGNKFTFRKNFIFRGKFHYRGKTFHSPRKKTSLSEENSTTEKYIKLLKDKKITLAKKITTPVCTSTRITVENSTILYNDYFHVTSHNRNNSILPGILQMIIKSNHQLLSGGEGE